MDLDRDSLAYTAFKQRIENGEIDGEITASLERVYHGAVWYSFMWNDKLYRTYIQLCACGKSSCLTAESDMSLYKLFGVYK